MCQYIHEISRILASLYIYAAYASTMKLFCENQFMRLPIRDIVRDEMNAFVGNSTKASKISNVQVQDVFTS